MSESTTNTQPTPEDIEISGWNARTASHRFCALHPEFVQCQKNTDIIASWIFGIDSHGRPNTDRQWNLENLEASYAVNKDFLQLQTPPTSAPPAAPPPAEVKETKPWGRLTPAIVLQMDRETYKNFLKDPRFKEEVDKVMKEKP